MSDAPDRTRSYDGYVENRVRLGARRAVQAGIWYWEALAGGLDERLSALLTLEALALSVDPGRSRCQTLRRFHQVTGAQCLVMRTIFPGLLLLDASFGLRYSQEAAVGSIDPGTGGRGPTWVLRAVLEDRLWKIDPYTAEREWPEIGHFTIEPSENARSN